MGLKMKEALYPAGAAERLESGDVYLELTIGDGGNVTAGRVVYSSGYTELDGQALAAMKTTSGAMAGKSTGTHIVLARWTLPDAQRQGVEVLQIYAARVQSVP